MSYMQNYHIRRFSQQNKIQNYVFVKKCVDPRYGTCAHMEKINKNLPKSGIKIRAYPSEIHIYCVIFTPTE